MLSPVDEEKEGDLLSPLLVVLEAPADTIRHVKEIKGICIIKKETCVDNSDDMVDEVENSKGFAKKKYPKTLLE